jgi:adenylate cyclase
LNDGMEEKARAAVARILRSATFEQSERLRRFLEFIVTETLAGNGGRLKGYAIAVEVFDRDHGFDSTVNPIVRVEAARLRAKLREYYETEGRDDPVRLVMPKGGYVIQLEERQPASAALGRGSLAMQPEAADRTPPVGEAPSLAVLPFTNLSNDQEQGYFADGITDTLITELSRLPELLVISRQSSFAYRNAPMKAEEISRELGVRYLLHGSVQRAASRVRIIAQLIDAESGAHLWAERFDREIENVFHVQDEVVRHIMAVLQVRIVAGSDRLRSPQEEGPRNLEAHDRLMRGLERFWIYTQESMDKAHGFFKQAVELAPTDAEAHAWLARALVFRWLMYWDERPDGLEQAYHHARTAVDLGPRLPQAYTVLCWVQLWRRECAAAAAAGRRAATLDPNNADAHMFIAYALSVCGKGKEAMHHIEKALRLNPHPSSLYHFTLGQCYYVLKDYEKAIEAFRQGVAVWNAFYPNHFYLCLTYTLLGREEEARSARESLLALTEGRRPALRRIQLHSGVDQELERRAGLID